MTTRKTQTRRPTKTVKPAEDLPFPEEVRAATAIVNAALQPADAVIVIALRGTEVAMDAEADINQAAAMLTFANTQIEAAALKARLAELGHPVN